MSSHVKNENYVREFQDLLLGLPALATAIGIAVIIAVHHWTPQERIADRYWQAARHSYQAGQYQRAKEYFQRLWLLKGGSSELRYWLALSEFGLGHQEAAAAMLSRLTPPHGQGYPPAHIWCARRYLASPSCTPQDRASAEQHLVQALKSDPENAEAHALLGDLYLSTGQPALAEQHFQQAVEQLPLLRLSLAQAQVAMGKNELARAQAQIVQEFLGQQTRSDPNNHVVRLQRAQTALFLKDFSRAASILREGLAASDVPGYRRALGSIYAAWSDAKSNKASFGEDERLRLLEQGLFYDVGNVEIWKRLVAISQADGPSTDRARALVERALAEGKSVATIHLFLAMQHHQQGRIREAREHYEEVYRREPQVAVAANNLAWLLAHSDPLELTRALEMIDGAVKQWPHQPEIRDTRAHILAQMKRWHEARVEFEAVLVARPGTPDLHRALAEVYDQLGATDKAAEQRDLARIASRDQ